MMIRIFYIIIGQVINKKIKFRMKSIYYIFHSFYMTREFEIESNISSTVID